jgi:hypothetical protein
MFGLLTTANLRAQCAPSSQVFKPLPHRYFSTTFTTHLLCRLGVDSYRGSDARKRGALYIEIAFCGLIEGHLEMAATGVTEGPKLFQGVARNDFAFKLLKQMGWEEGMGLGKEKQGIKTHIRVRKNVEQSGVGLVEARKQAADWTINTSIYDRILANLKVKSAGEGKRAAVQSESESESELEEDNNEKKKELKGETAEAEVKRSKKRKASKEEPSVAAEEVEKEQPRKLARHVGRYKKREASKSVAGYASHHLQEILVSALRMSTGAGQTITIVVYPKQDGCSCPCIERLPLWAQLSG